MRRRVYSVSRSKPACSETADAGAESRSRLSPAELRRELSHRNQLLAESLAHESTFGGVPSILYRDLDGRHGNFIAASYRRICASPEWTLRLNKCYTASHQVPRPQDRRRRELDCANSSDALLMNIFCYPGVTARSTVCRLLGIEPGVRPRFGVRTNMPCVDGLSDRTEVDMLLGHLLVEAKLTEGGFRNARRKLIHRYAGVHDVFDTDELPATKDGYRNYQLIRGVLAAHHSGRSFLLLCDSRRPDLSESWYQVASSGPGWRI
jgi:hypothetical protein